MALLGSIAFNLIFYSSLIPISIVIIVTYFFVSTKTLQTISSYWIKFILLSLKFLCRVSWKVEGETNIPKSPCIIVSNHQGQWESFFIQTLSIPSTSIIKRELLYIPFFGWALKCMRPITLNRKNKFSSIKKVIEKGVARTQEGFNIILFPEGTRINPENGIQQFANSCGILSVKAGVPIIPICHNSGNFWKNKHFIKYPGEIMVKIGPPIYGDDAKELTGKAYEWIKKNYLNID